MATASPRLPVRLGRARVPACRACLGPNCVDKAQPRSKSLSQSKQADMLAASNLIQTFPADAAWQLTHAVTEDMHEGRLKVDMNRRVPQSPQKFTDLRDLNSILTRQPGLVIPHWRAHSIMQPATCRPAAGSDGRSNAIAASASSSCPGLAVFCSVGGAAET